MDVIGWFSSIKIMSIMWFMSIMCYFYIGVVENDFALAWIDVAIFLPFFPTFLLCNK